MYNLKALNFKIYLKFSFHNFLNKIVLLVRIYCNLLKYDQHLILILLDNFLYDFKQKLYILFIHIK
jgi:hypothetical protein